MQQPDIATVPPRPKAPATRDPVDVISRWIGNGELPMSELSTRLQKERPHDMCQWLGTAGPRTFLEKHTERFSIDRTGSATMVRLVRKAATPPTP